MLWNRKLKGTTAAVVLAVMLLQPFVALAGTSTSTGAAEPAAAALIKLMPVTVSADTSQLPPDAAAAEDAAVQRLFDSDTGSSYEPTQASRVTFTLAAPASVGSLRVYGASPYQLNLYRDGLDGWEPVSSLSGALTGLSDKSWNTLAADTPVAAGKLLLEMVPQGNVTAGVPEVELWGTTAATATGDVPHATLAGLKTPQEALKVLAAGDPNIFSVAATPTEISIPDGSADNASTSVTLTVAQNPTLFKRAYLLYDGYNILRPVSIRKRINNGSWSGGYQIPQPTEATPSWSSQLEEINPDWLVQGENKVEFSSPSGAAAVRNLRLLVESDSGWNSVSSVSAPAVYDGDVGTSFPIHASGNNPELQANFERTVEPHKMRLHLNGPVGVAAALQYLSGGNWQEVKAGWKLDLSALKAGWNEVAVPAAVAADALRLVFDARGLRLKTGAQSGSINELRISASPVGSLSTRPRIVVSYPRDGEFFGRTAYLQGFATPGSAGSGNAEVTVAGKSSANQDGSFSLALSKDEAGYANDSDDAAWAAQASSSYAGTNGASYSVTLDSNADAASARAAAESKGNAPVGDSRAKYSDTVSPGQAKKISHDGVTVDIPEGAVDSDTEITIIPLNQADLAKLDPGMVNVTSPAAGYRFLPHGMKFKKPIRISFGYAKNLLPAGQTDNDVSMFYYDEKQLMWQPLARASVDGVASQVVSESTHFTDIINTTLVVPDHPQALSLNPNSIKDLKAADPTAKVNLIEPPKVNNKGTANLSYPIDIPPGRNKLQPDIEVRYNSAGGNGWMGVGWDIPLQEISIDTRWGVPRYDAANESETYTLDGEQLAPVAHRGAQVPRTQGTTQLPGGEVVKIFHPRVEGPFRRIVRHGSAPSNYWWEVIDKNGTRYCYGGAPGANNVPDGQATLTDHDKGNIFKWALRQVRDTNGNTVNYGYTVLSNPGIKNGSQPGYQLYLSRIDYTGHNAAPGAYSVLFTRDRDLPNFVQRDDVGIDARGGFKMVTADLLKRIEVHARNASGQDALVRSYGFDYQHGAFNKTLLQAVSQYGANGTLFNRHEFSYYDNVRQSDGTYNGFSSADDWSTGSDGVAQSFLGVPYNVSVLGGSEGTNDGGTLYVGFAPEPTKAVSAGAKLGTSSSDTDGVIAMVDVNGDGLPDKVYKCGDAVCYRLNTSGPHSQGPVTFGERHQIAGISDISRDHSDQFSGGAQGFLAGASATFDFSSTTTTQSTYFADVNGDGLVDLVSDGVVYFNTGKLDAYGNLLFTSNSNLTPAPVNGTSSVDATGMIPDMGQLYDRMVDQNPLLDGVRRWVAPYDGTIAIAGGIQLVDTSLDRAANHYTSADGVRVAVQKEGSELWSTTIGGSDFSLHTPTGLDGIAVHKGDRIYFRVQSVLDGSYDQVNWNPVITYAEGSATQSDVNGLPVYRFTAGDDMVYAGREFPVTLPFRGKVRIKGSLTKKVTSDDITVAVYLNNVQVRSATLSWDQVGSTPAFDDLDVQYHDVLKLKVLADSDIDLKQIDWQPQVFYVQANYPNVTPLDGNGNPATDASGNAVGPAPGSPVTVQDDQGNYTVQLKAPYDVEFYPANALSAPQQSWVAPQTGTLLVTPYLSSAPTDAAPSFAADSQTVFTVKRRNALLGKSAIAIAAGVPYDPQQHTLQVPVSAGDELFFDFSGRDQSLAGKLQGVSATVSYLGQDPVENPPVAVPSALHSHLVPSVFSKPYRGWGYIAYNGNRTRATEPIHQELLVVSSGQSAYTPSLPTSSSQSTVPAQDFYIAMPDAVEGRWTSADKHWWMAPAVTSSSRLGLQFPSVPTADKYNGAVAPAKITQSTQMAAGAGYYVSLSRTDTPNQTILDYLDLNGDGFPDVVSQGRVQYTTMLGTLSSKSTDNLKLAGPVRQTETTSLSIGAGGTVPDIQDASDKKPPAKQQSQNPSYGLSGSLGESTSVTKCDMMDVNGDGLPDSVCQNADGTVTVQLNLGYSFGAPEKWEGAAIMNDGSSQSGSLSFSYTDGVKGFAGGPSVSTSSTTNTSQLIDVNGDGLLDRVYNDGDNIWVSFNTGAKFAPAVLWSRGGRPVSSGFNASYAGGVSYYYEIGPLCLVGCFIIINPEVNGGKSISREESTLRDIKGDGTADLLYSKRDDTLSVAVNRTQNTNLLKSVKRPLGGSITLEYQREGNTPEMPQSVWTLNRSTLTDGKGSSYVTAYSYADGYKDRYNREFYGFRTVAETHAPGSAVERSITETFHTTEFNDDRDYYLKGLLLKSVTTDKVGHVWASSANTYTPYQVVEGQSTVAYAEFPALTRTDSYFYDGTGVESDYRKSTFQTFAYDNFGNVITFFDAGELASSADDVTATIHYWSDPQQYIMKPDTITVTDAGKNVLRKRWASYQNGTGDLLSHTSLINSGQNAVWGFSYDAFGNLQTITDPVGYTLTYSYDSDTNSYLTRIQDNFSGKDGGPYYSTAGYDLLFGLPAWTRDLNGNYEVSGYDEFGRLSSVYGPYDTDDSGNPLGIPTLAFQYVPPALGLDGETLLTPAGAVTRNKASSQVGRVGKTLDTVLYADGMKRVLETKKEADVNGAYGMTVSGLLVYDDLSRTVQQGQPIFQSGGDLYGYLPQQFPKNPTRTDYDPLDRVVKLETPDAQGRDGYAVTTTSYGFGQAGNTGLLYETTKVVDPIGTAAGEANRKGTKISYKDVDERIAAIVEYNNGSPITTNYGYDPLGQITAVVDNKGNRTTVEYDLVGRRTAIANPDTGRTEYGYDANGNLTSKLSANYQRGREIRYGYTFNRLMQIDYPYSTGVLYQYGPMNAAYNRAGRISTVSDESGVEERFYGKLGETTREVKSVAAKTPSAQTKSYSTDYVFDSFGRMLQMTYPDAETLYYSYDNGGLLKSAWGVKQGNRYNYLNNLTYDEFGQRRQIAYGNGVNSDYSYDELTRRLAKLTTVTPDGRTIQNMSYGYDLVGNVLRVQNAINTPTNTALPAGPATQVFEYDDLYQLKTANGEYAFGPGKQNLYSNELFYDTIGNFTRKSQINKILQPSTTATLPKETNYVLDYQYGGIHPHAVTSAGDKAYSYDAAGNMTGWTSQTSGKKRTIIWNEENRVKEIDDNGKATYFLYDDAGERVLKRGQYGETFYINRFYSIKNGELGSKSVYAGNTRLLSKLVKTPNTATANSATSIPGIQGLNHGSGNKTGIISRLPNGTTTGVLPPEEKDQYFYHGDHLGSSNMITNASGAVYQHLEYFPFGETWIDEGKTPTNIPGYQFTGKELDPETGLYYFGARYYEPVISRWISADPALERYLPNNLDKNQLEKSWKPEEKLPGFGGIFRPVNLGLYTYAGNNPIRFFDPDGNAVFESGAKLMDAGNKAEAQKSFQPSHGVTYCNRGVNFIEQKGGNSDYKGKTANQIINKLSDPKYATKVTAKQAVEYAKRGVTVVAGVKGEKHGHVAIVAPKDAVKSKGWGSDVPYIFNIGKKNEIMKASGAFRRNEQPTYYIRNVDLPTK